MKWTIVAGWEKRVAVVALVISVVFAVATGAGAGESQSIGKRPSFRRVKEIAKAALREQEEYKPGDLINRSDVERILKVLALSGWQPADRKQLLADTLAKKNPLVRILSTERGQKFMRKVKDYELIYSRMDRICRVRDGKRMLVDLAKLPDGERYAKIKTPPGVPNFIDLLPKRGSSKLRSIEDYKKPTGRIYTEKQLLKRLKKSYISGGRACPNGKLPDAGRPPAFRTRDGQNHPRSVYDGKCEDHEQSEG